ncbi:MAG: hypothetical protein ALECFALPRED_000663 [Alectoria fallacina]|uniref:Carbohydrate-binding module family 19 domain-containing protein n=1 Tax=Alectoria fallacina TaxID=1903189 RepID=A0A8H3I826_9LECA|nr:MAG: hypothetical protein ALECFALPRED_000663 [Alectoria fallacina]
MSSLSITPSIAASSETSAFVTTSSTTPATKPLIPDVTSSSDPTADTLTVSTPSQVSSTTPTLPSTLSTRAVSEHSDAATGTTPVSTSALVYVGSMNTENQGSAVVQPAETLSRLFNLVGNPPNDLQSSTNAPSFSSTPSPRLGASNPTISNVQSTFNVPKVAAKPSSSSTQNQVPSSSEVALLTSSTAAAGPFLPSSTAPILTSSPAAASQTPSQVVVPIPISSGVVQVLGAGGDTGNEFAPVTLDRSAPAPTGSAKYPTAEGGNTAMAAGFNDVYKTLNEDTACSPTDPSQAYACVDGEIAECQSDETYVLKSCPSFQSCYALPKPSGLTGVVVQCAVPSDAYSILAGLSSSTASPVAVTSQPAQILQAEGDFSQATQSVSAQNPAQPLTSSSSVPATIQSQTMVPAPSVLAVTATASPDQGSGRVDNPTVLTSTSPTSVQEAFQIQSQASTTSVNAVTATAQQVHDSNSFKISGKSDTSPPVPSTTAAIVSVPKALFAVVTAVENDRVSSNENSAQVSVATTQTSQPSPGISTPVVKSSAMSPPAVPVNEKVAVGNGQATVTVTVTVTTTEKSPAVTVTAS